MSWVNLNDLYATKSELATKVPTSRTINGKALSSNVTLAASDIKLSDSTTLQSAWDSISQTFWSGSEKSVTITIPNLKSRKVLFIETEQTRTFITIPTYDMSSRRFSSLAIHPTNYFSLLGARITVSISGNKLSLEYADYGVYTVSNLGSSPVFAAGDQGRFLAVYG